MNKKLLLLTSAQPADQEFVTELGKLCSIAVEIKNIAKAQELAQEVKTGLTNGDSVFVDAAFSEGLDQIKSLGLKKIELNRLHFICPPDDKALLGAVFESQTAENIVFRKYGVVANAAALYAKVILSSYLSEPFGLQKIFGEDVQVDTVKFNEAIERGFVSQALTQQLSQLGYNELIIPAVTTAVDELLMNAMFDAPVDDSGKQIYARQSRNINIKLTGKQNVEMQVGGKDDFIGVTVSDFYGSLDPQAVRQHIAKSFNGRQDDERDSSLAGAGLGLSLILKRGGSLIFTYKAGVRTDSTVFFRRTDRLKDFNRQFQFVCMRTVL